MLLRVSFARRWEKTTLALAQFFSKLSNFSWGGNGTWHYPLYKVVCRLSRQLRKKNKNGNKYIYRGKYSIFNHNCFIKQWLNEYFSRWGTCLFSYSLHDLFKGVLRQVGYQRVLDGFHHFEREFHEYSLPFLEKISSALLFHRESPGHGPKPALYKHHKASQTNPQLCQATSPAGFPGSADLREPERPSIYFEDPKTPPETWRPKKRGGFFFSKGLKIWKLNREVQEKKRRIGAKDFSFDWWEKQSSDQHGFYNMFDTIFFHSLFWHIIDSYN